MAPRSVTGPAHSRAALRKDDRRGSGMCRGPAPRCGSIATARPLPNRGSNDVVDGLLPPLQIVPGTILEPRQRFRRESREGGSAFPAATPSFWQKRASTPAGVAGATPRIGRDVAGFFKREEIRRRGGLVIAGGRGGRNRDGFDGWTTSLRTYPASRGRGGVVNPLTAQAGLAGLY
jgi:hypothetical protein